MLWNTRDTPPLSDVSARIQALEATPGPTSISLDDICQAQADNDSLQPVLQALKDQTKPPQSDLRQYPEDARMLLSQLDSLILQEGVLYRKFHYPDGSIYFLQTVLLTKLHHSYIKWLLADFGHFWTNEDLLCSLLSRLLSWVAFNDQSTSTQSAPAESKS